MHSSRSLERRPIFSSMNPAQLIILIERFPSESIGIKFYSTIIKYWAVFQTFSSYLELCIISMHMVNKKCDRLRETIKKDAVASFIFEDKLLSYNFLAYLLHKHRDSMTKLEFPVHKSHYRFAISAIGGIKKARRRSLSRRPGQGERR